MNDLSIDSIAIEEMPMEWTLLETNAVRDGRRSVAEFNRFRTENISFVEDVLW